MHVPQAQEQLRMVYLSTSVAVCGSYAFGTCAGYSSPTQAAMRKDLKLSLSEDSMFGSILTIGAMIGAITSGCIADLIGRKWAMRISSCSCIGGWLAIYFAQGVVFLYLGRLATGYGMGVFSYVVPVYIAEIAPKNVRGTLTTFNQLMISSGISVAFIIGTMISWRTLALTGLVPCTIQLVGLFFIPESPRWLVKKGRQNEFRSALQKLRGKKVDISHEMDKIQEYIDTIDQLPKAKMLDLFRRRYLRSVMIGVGLMVCQQLGGINGICFFVSNIFESAGFSAHIGTIIYAGIQIVVTGLGAALMDKVGRKPLLLVSGTGLVLGCLVSGIGFFMEVHEIALRLSSILVLLGIMLYIASYSVGMGPVPWLMMSEIFPINIKGTAGSLATFVHWGAAWAVSFTFNYLMVWSSYGTFLIYAAINGVGIWFIVMVVPETKGKTLEQIHASNNT